MPPRNLTKQPEPTQAAPIPPTVQPPATIASQPPAYDAGVPSKKRFPKWLKVVGLIFVVFLALIVFAAITAFTATKAPQKISDKFVNDVQAGNTSAAYALTSKTFQQATTRTQLDQVVKRVSPVLQGEEKVSGRAIQKSTGASQTAVLVYDVKTSGGTRYVKVELQKSGDVWQVINFNFRSADKALDSKVE